MFAGLWMGLLGKLVRVDTVGSVLVLMGDMIGGASLSVFPGGEQDMGEKRGGKRGGRRDGSDRGLHQRNRQSSLRRPIGDLQAGRASWTRVMGGASSQACGLGLLRRCRELTARGAPTLPSFAEDKAMLDIFYSPESSSEKDVPFGPLLKCVLDLSLNRA